MWIDEVTEVLREAARVAILPRFRALSAGEATQKAPGEWVTVADREAEKLISRRLRQILAGLALSSQPALFDEQGGFWLYLPQLLWPVWGTALAAATLAYYLRRRTEPGREPAAPPSR